MADANDPDGLERAVLRAGSLIGVDLGFGGSVSAFVCVCGFTCSKASEMLQHLKGHGMGRRVADDFGRDARAAAWAELRRRFVPGA